ncbi:PadR family transcriptional regulator [Lysinibacter sp. HNR]|uniref:PadR family transcriptional regulator n=1 Tax=Lysinibacter sp. HNR TaxID=3031408 RepID=UPI002434BE7E|nr:PadR family transcriptional regulator [Lysinibacter sp. HNR]WGD37751.1 PadR family transcriptional regulator [Lysinibacter sp. HNR]
MASECKLTPLAVAVLALLLERPMHPYEVYQLLMQRSMDSFVKVRPGSLYHTFERLLKGGTVRAVGTEREGNRPERTTYEITSEGREAMERKVREMLAESDHEYPNFPLAVGEAHNIPRETAVMLLSERLERKRAEVAVLDTKITSAEEREIPKRYWLAADFCRAMTTAEIGWLKSLIADIETGDIPWGQNVTKTS